MALSGTLIGLMIASASDIGPTAAIFALFPGLVPGFLAAKLYGRTVGIVVCGLTNGTIYGTLWYAWLRVLNSVISRIPVWSKRVAVWWVG